jgi:hypothetical protein
VASVNTIPVIIPHDMIASRTHRLHTSDIGHKRQLETKGDGRLDGFCDRGPQEAEAVVSPAQVLVGGTVKYLNTACYSTRWR